MTINVSIPGRGKRRRRNRKGKSKPSSLARRVRRLEQSREVKFFTSGPTATACNELGNIYNIVNDVAQGDSQVQRDGSSVYNKSMDLDLWITRNSTATVPQIVRVIVLNDKQDDLAVADFWGSVAAGSSYNWMEGKLSEFRFSSKVLYDRTFNLNEATNISYVVKKKIPLGFSTQYDASSTTINNNSIKIFAISSSTAAGALLPTVVYRTRVHFTDS